MKNILLILVTGLLLFATVYFRNGHITQQALLLIGLLVVITSISIVIVSKMYPAYSLILCSSICGFVLILFVPCLATFPELATPLSSSDFNRSLVIFIFTPLILICTVIFSYRHYFIVE